jgi:hypothetical protein
MKLFQEIHRYPKHKRNDNAAFALLVFICYKATRYGSFADKHNQTLNELFHPHSFFLLWLMTQFISKVFSSFGNSSKQAHS